jgi:hypothetical protein
LAVTLVRDNIGRIRTAVAELTRARVYVGIPGDAPARKAEAGQKTPPTNAVIGYAMEYGLPEKNVPARPFLMPGVAAAQDEIATLMRRGLDLAISGDAAAPRRCLEHVGTVGARAVRDRIDSNVPPPLALGTIEARARRGVAKDVKRRGRKGAKQYLKLLAEGTPQAVLEDLGENALVKTLQDTGQLRNSVTYVVRDR